MGEYRITGGARLTGEVTIGGSKNAVLPILAATVLGKRSVIHNCPKISDTYCTIDILRGLGCDVGFDGHTIVVDARGIASHHLPEDLMDKMRSSIIFAGGLLGRFGLVVAHYPGGCSLGDRPIDLHLEAFRQLGALVEEEGQVIYARAKKLAGARVVMKKTSVGATQNAILAAVLAKGTTTIENAAREPEIVDLQRFLVAAGAKVTGAGTSTVIIEGVAELGDVEHTIMPDRIVAGTYLAAGAITGGHIRLNNVVYEDIKPIADRLADAGVTVTLEEKAVALAAPQRLAAIDYMATGPHPGFPTDMQPQFTAMLATAHGNSIISEKVFDARDKHVAELAKMGADIRNVDRKRFHISGVQRLHGAVVEAHDLRCGAALILAGLGAYGETVVGNSIYVERGYEAIHQDLQALGADVKFVTARSQNNPKPQDI
ncbi:MAG: UDP-N-acetylglucosamine 1-carboxyvinyltransferase [Defluviitaleaceae bacterium]|nr:UDP-N-acetylglucosamine 1-carboxyvinyltransferase [Defluviitaleaceae bacterium]